MLHSETHRRRNVSSYDVLRALALFGMLVVNFLETAARYMAGLGPLTKVAAIWLIPRATSALLDGDVRDRSGDPRRDHLDRRGSLRGIGGHAEVHLV